MTTSQSFANAGPASLGDTLHQLDEEARRHGRPIRFYALHYANPVSFDLLGRSYRDITRFRFKTWGHATRDGINTIAVSQRANTCRVDVLPPIGVITAVTAAYVAPPVPGRPVLDQPTILATLTAMHAQSKSAGTRLPGYVVEFGQLQTFKIGKRYFANVSQLKFHSFRLHHGELLVNLTANARYAYPLPCRHQIVGIRPARARSREDRFASFEDFAKRFDKRFIADKVLLDLWRCPSVQHGGPYRPSDFRPIGKKGREVVAEFLRDFTGLDQASSAHDAGGVLTIKHYAQHEHIGRDISVSHSVRQGLIAYSSEYPGCGNGSYYILATEKTVLHLEND